MRYIIPFNESIETLGFKNFDKWVPEFFDYMKGIINIRKDADFFHTHIISNMLSTINEFKVPDNFIEKCKYLCNNYSTYSEKRELDDIESTYTYWLILKKLDISVYPDMLDILQDICDDNDLAFNLRSLDWVHNSRMYVTYMSFKFNLYDQMAILKDNIMDVESNISLSKDRISKIVSDIRNIDDRLKSLSCKSLGNIHYSGVIELNITLLK